MHVMCLRLRYIGVRAAAADGGILVGLTAKVMGEGGVGGGVEVNQLSLSLFLFLYVWEGRGG